MSMRRRLLSASTVLALTASMLVTAVPLALAVPVTETFSYTGADERFIVPAGVSSVRIKAVGGQGAGSVLDPGSTGGKGGAVTASFTVTTGDVLTITVAGDAGSAGNVCGAQQENIGGCGGFGGGGDSIDGGGGGGASSVRSGNTTLVVAGGGGGAGDGSDCGERVAGGNGGSAGSDAASGEDCVVSPTLTLGGGGGGRGGSAGNDAGLGGTVTGSDPCVNPSPGRPGRDGVDSFGGSALLGGGGGGGYEGGGSGASGASLGDTGSCTGQPAAGGGGGGASYVDPVGVDAAIELSDRVEANGLVTVTFSTPDITRPVLIVPAKVTVPATGSSGAIVTYDASATDDQLEPVIATCVPPSGSTFPVGVSTVTCTATDAAGNTGSASFTVTVGAPAAKVADLIVQVAGPSNAAAGSLVTYTLTVTNTGPGLAVETRSVLLALGIANTRSAPAAEAGLSWLSKLNGAVWSGATIAAGETATYTLTGTVSARPGSLIWISAVTASSLRDPNTGNNRTGMITRVT